MAQVAEVKGLFAGLVVHHPEVQLSVLQPAIHPVHLPVDGEGGVVRPDGDGGQLTPLPEREFKGHGHKVRLPQLPGHVGNDGGRRLFQAVEQVFKPGVPAVKAGHGHVHILPDGLFDEGAQLLLPYLSKAAPLAHRPGDIFQNVVEEGTHLGGVKSGRCPLLGPETVLHEVGKVAGVDPVDAAGGHPIAASVKGLHRLGAQPSPRHPGGPLHGGQGGAMRSIPGKVIPQRPTGIAPCRL